MAQYRCPVCGYIHDDSKEGTAWSSLAEDWPCPVCGAPKSSFEAIDGGATVGSDVDVDDESLTQQSGVPVDQKVSASASPLGRAVTAHRIFGYVFLAIYIIMMIQMIPRLWTYQIEFPARTVVHISLGMAIGAALILKLTIVRYFRRLDQALVPMLGTMLIISSVVLIGISVPSAFQEAFATTALFDEQNRDRVETLLAQTGLEENACTRFASVDSLRAGQQVLRQQCIECHDLRTVLSKPRTPKAWRQTVTRMADRTTLIAPLDDDEQWQVTAYLIALSPQLQASSKQKTDTDVRSQASKLAARAAATDQDDSPPYDAAAAKKLFDFKCSQCHQTDLVAANPPSSQKEVSNLVTMMVDAGLEAEKDELSLIIRYLTENYVKTSE